jgi:hypothetical protein
MDFGNERMNMAPKYFEFQDREKQRVVNNIMEKMKDMELYDLELLDDSARNIDVLRNLIKGLRMLSTWG